MNNLTSNLIAPETKLPLKEEPAKICETATFAQSMQRFSEETRRLHIQTGALGVAALCGTPLGWLLSAFLPVSLHGAAVGFGYLVCGAGFGGFLLTGFYRENYGPSPEFAHLLDECGPPELALLLARLSLRASGAESEMLWRAVIRIVKGLSPDEAARLPADVRGSLNEYLVKVKNEEDIASGHAKFCGAWLEILREIGDARDVAAIKPLTKMSLSDYPHGGIRTAAEQCLPHIEARIAAQEPGRTLLRAATSPQVAPETLLRPVAKANPTAPNQLLRPVETEDDSGEL